MKNLIALLSLILLSTPLMAALTRAEFEQVLQEFREIYGPELRRTDLRLQFKANWNDHRLKASVKIPDGKAIVTISGGYAKQKEMTADAFRIVLCHEMGHILGGAPKQKTLRWSTIEGQADYYATAKCLRRIVPEEDLTLERVKDAALRIGKMLVDRADLQAELSTERPSKIEVFTTQETHPAAQCRIDTMIAGFRCPISAQEDFSRTDPNIAACLHSSVDPNIRLGARPRCWYRPPTPRYRCITKEKIKNTQMPLVTIFQDDYREDNSWLIKIMAGLITPQNYIKQRVTINQAGQLRYMQLSQNQYQLIIDQQRLIQAMQLSTLKVETIDLPTDKQGNYVVNVTCQKL